MTFGRPCPDSLETTVYVHVCSDHFTPGQHLLYLLYMNETEAKLNQDQDLIQMFVGAGPVCRSISHASKQELAAL